MIPSFATVLTLVLAYIDADSARLPLAWNVGYLVPLGVAAWSWRPPRMYPTRGAQIGLGICACVLALMYSKFVVASAYVVAIAMWLRTGD